MVDGREGWEEWDILKWHLRIFFPFYLYMPHIGKILYFNSAFLITLDRNWKLQTDKGFFV